MKLDLGFICLLSLISINKNKKSMEKKEEKKAIVVCFCNAYYFISKECMPLEEAKKRFPTIPFLQWEFIQRDSILFETDTLDLIKKELKSRNYVIRKIIDQSSFKKDSEKN